MTMPPIIGIDLGTTNSLMAYVDYRTGLPRVIPDRRRQVLVPSVVSFTPRRGIPPMPTGIPEIKVTFWIDADRLLRWKRRSGTQPRRRSFASQPMGSTRQRSPV